MSTHQTKMPYHPPWRAIDPHYVTEDGDLVYEFILSFAASFPVAYQRMVCHTIANHQHGMRPREGVLFQVKLFALEIHHTLIDMVWESGDDALFLSCMRHTLDPRELRVVMRSIGAPIIDAFRAVIYFGVLEHQMKHYRASDEALRDLALVRAAGLQINPEDMAIIDTIISDMMQ